jgi:hypothetical protein
MKISLLFLLLGTIAAFSHRPRSEAATRHRFDHAKPPEAVANE